MWVWLCWFNGQLRLYSLISLVVDGGCDCTFFDSIVTSD